MKFLAKKKKFPMELQKKLIFLSRNWGKMAKKYAKIKKRNRK